MPAQQMLLGASDVGFDGVIRINAAGVFTNGSGTALTLKGVNNSGLELCGPFGEHPWGGTPPNWALLASWGANITRIPLNSASFLGLTTYNTSGGTWGSQMNSGVGNGTQDPFGDYKAAIISVITSCRAQGMYLVFDIHWGGIQLTLGGVTHYAGFIGQNSFMDTTGLTFWTDASVGFVAWLATNFGSAAFNTANGFNGGAAGSSYSPSYGGASGFGDMVFELFNEPFLGANSETFSAGTADQALLNGGTCNKYVQNPNTVTTATWTIAGYQACVTGIRALGATNAILNNGNAYSSHMQNYTVWRPTDTLTPSQVGQGWHTYCTNNYSYGTTFYPNTGGDTGSSTSTAVQWAAAVRAANIAVMITEDGTTGGVGNAGTSATALEPHMTYQSNWALANQVPYMGWTWGGQDFIQAFATSSAQNVMLRENSGSTALIPIEGEGWMMYLYLSGKPFPSITTASPLPAGVAGTSYSDTIVATGGAGAPWGYVKSSDSGTGLSLNATTGVLSGTLTATPGTYSFIVTATDQYGIFVAKTFSLTASAAVTVPTLVQLILQGNAKAGDNQGLGGSGHGPGAVSQPNHQSIGWKSVASATSYNIYRSVTTVAGTNGAYSLYDSVTASTSGSNYTTYVSNCTNSFSGSPFDPAPGIDSVYADTAATACVESNDTPGPASGIYYGPVTGYTYKVTAIVGGVESAQSSDCIAIFMGGGAWVMCGGIFNAPPTVTKAATAPAASPLGFTLATFFQLGHFPATQAYMNPYTGSGCVWGNLNVTGFNNIVVNVYPTAWVNGNMQQETEIDSDLFIYNSITPTMNVTLNQWNTFKFPLSSFLNSTNGSGSTMASSANGVRQTSYYKTTWNNGGGTDMTMYWEVYLSVT